MKPIKSIILIPLILLAALSISCSEPGIIPIHPGQIINETGFGQSSNWFDEQDTSALPTTAWDTPGTDSYWPAGIIIDFGREVRLTNLAIFDGEKSDPGESGQWEHRGGKLVFSTGTPFDWEELGTYKLDNNQEWHHVSFPHSTRYLQIKKVPTEVYFWKELGPFRCDLNVLEIVITGWPGKKGKKENTPDISSQEQGQRFPMKAFMGANSYKWIPDEINKAVGIIRDYHHWGTNGILSLDSSYTWVSRDGSMDLDSYFERIHLSNEFETFPDVHRHADPLLPSENRPRFGAPPDEPSSYALMADYLFQMAARYGHQKVEAGLLKVSVGEDTLSGCGWLNYYECWNEPDRWWGGADAHFTPYQLAAMTSAAYDGHLKSMGPGFGVKNADPAAKLVMGGLASLDLQYMDAMLLWTRHYREGSFPADVINFHHYSNSAGQQHQGSKVFGISPEADKLQTKLEELVDWRNRHLPDCEVWLSEFGWDTHASSSQSASGHLLYPDQVDMFYLQAIWLVRGYLLGAASGIDRMFMYLANDLGNDGLYRNCGLVYADYSPKLSWYYVHALKEILGDLKYSASLDTGRDDVLAYQFKNRESGRTVTALWCPTSDGTRVENFSFTIPPEASDINLVELAEGSISGIRSTIKEKQELLLLDVSEQPLFVEYRVQP